MASPNRQALLGQLVGVVHDLPMPVIQGVAKSLEGLPVPATKTAFDSALQGVANSNARATLKDLFHRWAEHYPSQSGASLAWALRGAVATDRSWRDSASSELVWTGPAPAKGVLRRTEQALKQVIETAERELWLVSFAGYGFRGLAEALLEAAERGVGIRMIIESPEMTKGGLTYSNLIKIGASLGEAATVYIWPLEKRKASDQGKTGLLHVKAGLADEKMLFVTSANLTGHAMHLNMEMGVLLSGGETPRRAAEHFRWLIHEKYLVPVKQ